MTVAELVADERKRQVASGYDSAHDDIHDDGSINLAAQAYCQSALQPGLWIPEGVPPYPPVWPWEAKTFRSTGDPIRDLVKAGALIDAEIGRLLRARS